MHSCARMHAHAQKQRKGLSSCQMNEKDTATTQRNTQFLSFCVHTTGVCTSGFSWSAPPPTTMLPVNPRRFITRCDTPTRRRAHFTIFCIKIKSRRRSFSSLHLQPRCGPGRCTPLQGQRRPAGWPAARSASLLTYNHLLRLIHCKLQPVLQAGRRGCSEPISSQ